MKIFHSSNHTLHAPQWYIADGTVRPCPELPDRVPAILHALQAAGHEPLETTIDPTPAIHRTHDSAYLHYLQTIHPIWTAEFGNCDVIPDTFPRRITKTPPTKPSAQAGYYCFDMAAPITAGTWTAAQDSAALAVAAADALLHNQISYALCRPPGHHAGRNYCGGFCYLNNIAIAAQHLLLHGKKRLAILDIDYHHGNGTQDIFYSRSDVRFISIHADPNSQYPYFWGHADETGEAAGAHHNINLPLPRGASESLWLQTLDIAMTHVKNFAPDALLISVGADIHEADTVGDFNISTPAFAEIGRRLRAPHLPTAFFQEGGYNVAKIGDCITRLLHPFETS